jgi:predicted AlkP superfamily pyrophosphatase or phosphodiesterase
MGKVETGYRSRLEGNCKRRRLKRDAMVNPKMESISIFILIDALGYEIVGEDFLSLIDMKTRVRVKTVLGYSIAAHPSIISGKLPSEHGYWCSYYYSPKTSVFKRSRFLTRLLPNSLLEHYRVRFRVRNLSIRLAHLPGDFPLPRIPLKYLWLFDAQEKEDFYHSGLGQTETIFDKLNQSDIDFELLKDTHISDSEKVAQALKLLENSQSRFYFIYLAEMDDVLHKNAKWSEQVKTKLKWYEECVYQIYEKACHKAGRVNLFVFSDHGMTPTIGTFNLMEGVHQLGYKVPRDYVAFYDSTMARFWFFSLSARMDISRWLSTIHCGTILDEVEMRRLGVFFEDHKYGELIFLMNPGWNVEPSFMRRKAHIGMHGFHPDDKDSDAIFFSNVEIYPPPTKISDFFQIILNFAVS